MKKKTGIMNEEMELIELERKWGEASMQRDLATLDRIVANDWVGTNPDGSVENKSHLMALLRSPSVNLESLNTDDVKVRVFGETAVVTGRYALKVQRRGRHSGGEYRYTDVFVKRGKQWQVVNSHLTRIAQ